MGVYERFTKMKLTITKIDSAIIHNFRYNYDTKEMTIEFKGGSSYLYKDVNKVVVNEFIEAESKGKYINSIKSDYEFEKVDNVIGTQGQPSKLI